MHLHHIHERMDMRVHQLFIFSNVYPQTTQGMFLIPPLTQVSMYAIYICVYAFLMWIFSLLLNRILRSFSWQDILSYIFSLSCSLPW